MKTIIKLVFFVATLFMFSCSTDDSAPMDTAVLIKQIEDRIKSGTWRITSYVDDGQNETDDYTCYNFTFNENGSLVATNGTATINGTWSVTDDSNSSDDDSNDDDIDFNIFFSAPPDFEELSDDWDIVATSTSKVDLIDVSGGNGGTDTLVFERN